MNLTKEFLTTWTAQLAAAEEAARAAGEAIRGQFGQRLINEYKGPHDVQLTADVIAQKVIVESLREAFPHYGIVAEEGGHGTWEAEEFLWAVDPLDGTNNFGYGIAHCAVAITLFHGDVPVLAVIADPVTDRFFSATGDGRTSPPASPCYEVPLRRATVSLVTGYAEEGRRWGQGFTGWMSPRCKRLVNLWAPAMDLALVASGALDAMVCRDAALLDVCGGMFLVESFGGHVVDFDGEPLGVRRSMHRHPVSFIAARDPHLAADLVAAVRAYDAAS
ncbi:MULTISPECIES: inositol monophosphatase family protein [Thermomonospora]|uniref:Inositol monophosphatase n=1 Tax=Thermomonospora curvata (strain ATCC 19995 / DSM 43183 / JCM 3096 / KCTC 9072 / NBRC 15933 / NCIMB 10081 / Henssen B9) TaxID=471852 RepID=D1ADX5_THECD|nr:MULTISPECIES: inositol monophosphatase [Thermomonospora]ACY97585.1 inositol monophosphatase [Thermomonospora curvata DSM 43183]PKK14531.1 MAG: inositol monophosphatase [Thermomonospora sp. CIF 1]